MAIKDQCEQCRKFNTTCNENIEFNGLSCNQYAKIIDLDKKEMNVEDSSSIEEETIEQSVNHDYPNPDVNIHGWLSFFLFAIGLGGVFSAGYPIFTYNVAEYDGSHFLAMTDVFIGIMLCALAGYTIYAFLKRKSDAVYLAKLYIIVVFVTNLLSLIGGEFEATRGVGSMTQVVRGLIWAIIWFLYMTFSNQVQEIIPKTYRKVFSRDYYITAIFIIVPLLMLAIGIADIQTQHQKKETLFISSADLAYNEYTDGRIIFTKPDGFTCDKQEIEEPRITIFDLELVDNAWIRICSDYDTDISVQNFNSYWENWRNEDFAEYTSNEILNEKRSVNGNPYYIKTIQYNTDTPILWHYILLFNNQTGKVCLIDYYQIKDSDNYLDTLLKSIRF